MVSKRSIGIADRGTSDTTCTALSIVAGRLEADRWVAGWLLYNCPVAGWSGADRSVGDRRAQLSSRLGGKSVAGRSVVVRLIADQSAPDRSIDVANRSVDHQ